MEFAGWAPTRRLRSYTAWPTETTDDLAPSTRGMRSIGSMPLTTPRAVAGRVLRRFPAVGDRLPRRSVPEPADEVVPDRLRRYAGGELLSIEGWLSGDAVWPLVELARQQHDAGITGAVGEIGVHHGQLFLLLAFASRPGESCVGVDLFENQDQNIDHSGQGDREILEGHIARLGAPNERIRLLTRNSLTLTAEEMIATADDRYRLFSVDGGHTPDITANDLLIAGGAIRPEGIVILDDAFSQMWPGVMTGLVQFMQAHPDLLVPFGICGNKTLLTTPAHAEHWRRALEPAAPHYMSRTDELLGHPVQILLDGPGLTNAWIPRNY